MSGDRCGQPAPHAYNGATGDCDRPAGHDGLHAAHLPRVVLRWADADENGCREVRAEADGPGEMRLR